MDAALGQQLIDAFFQALNLKHLEQCQAHLEALRRVSQNEPPYQAWCSYLTGVLINERDRDWAEGERVFRTLLETDLEPDLRGRVLIALGRTYDYQGRWQEALEIYKQCLTHFDQTSQDVDRAIIWRNMAITLNKAFIRGELDRNTLQQAVTYCRRALLTLENLESDPSPTIPSDTIPWNLSASWSTLGLIYQNLGDWSEAAYCHKRDIALGQSLNDLYGVAAANHNLGEVLQQQGPAGAPEALQAYLAALKIYRDFHDTYNEIDLLSNLGSLHRDMGQPDAALDYYQQALALAESIRARLTAPNTQADYRTTIEKLYLAPVSIHLERGEAALAFTAAERARSRVLADLLAGQEAKPQADVPAHLLEQRADLRHLLDQAYAADPPPTNLPGLELALADLDRQIELLDPGYAGLSAVEPLTAEAVCARLAPDAVLLTYTADDQDRLWILVASPAGVQHRPVEKLTVSWLRDYLTSCLDQRRRGGLLPKLPSGHLGSPQLFPSLFRALIEPVWDSLLAARTLYIIPVGPLHYLALGALTPALDQPPPLLAAGRRVVYAPSATILFTYCHSRPPSPYRSILTIAPHDEQLQFTIGAAQAIAQQTAGTTLTGTA
ncbi:MAG TPA: tetratricopeptide repeat protein, partial [Anaerolineae bacterium]